jgi:hypothetical protein
MTTIKVTACLRPEQVAFLRTHKYMSVSKIVQTAIYEEQKREEVMNRLNKLLKTNKP